MFCIRLWIYCFVIQVKQIKRGDAFSAGNKNSNVLSKQKNETVITILILSIGNFCVFIPGSVLWTVRNSLGIVLFSKDVNNFLFGTRFLNLILFACFYCHMWYSYKVQYCTIFRAVRRSHIVCVGNRYCSLKFLIFTQ